MTKEEQTEIYARIKAHNELQSKLAELEVQVEKLVDVLNWTRDGIQHFDDRGQVDHLCNEIDAKLTDYEAWKGKL